MDRKRQHILAAVLVGAAGLNACLTTRLAAEGVSWWPFARCAPTTTASCAPCATDCAARPPACYGYYPTCWRRWPEECPGCQTPTTTAPGVRSPSESHAAPTSAPLDASAPQVPPDVVLTPLLPPIEAAESVESTELTEQLQLDAVSPPFIEAQPPTSPDVISEPPPASSPVRHPILDLNPIDLAPPPITTPPIAPSIETSDVSATLPAARPMATVTTRKAPPPRARLGTPLFDPLPRVEPTVEPIVRRLPTNLR